MRRTSRSSLIVSGDRRPGFNFPGDGLRDSLDPHRV
jgi:hypothetical protein